MDINIPKYSGEPTMDTISLPSDHMRLSITGTPPALPKVCKIPSSKTMHVRLKNSRGNLTYLKGNHVHFPALPKVCKIPSSKTMHVRLKNSRGNLTYLKGNHVHFLSANCGFVTPVSRLFVISRAIDPQDMKDKK